MLHIVSFSTGLSSALTAARVLERYGRENVEIVFLDTGIEDDDNYRFMRDFESRFGVRYVTWAEVGTVCSGRPACNASAFPSASSSCHASKNDSKKEEPRGIPNLPLVAIEPNEPR